MAWCGAAKVAVWLASAAPMQPARAAVLLLPAGPLQVAVSSLHAARFATTVHQRFDFSCGSAALATLLRYHYDLPADEQAVFEAMLRTGDAERIRREGFSLLDMKRFLASHGFQADGFMQPLDRLQQAGLPAIALINDNGYRHFVVIKGLRDHRVLLGDPSRGLRVMTRGAFEAAWVNQLLFVIHSHRAAARFNAEADWRGAPPAPLAVGLVNDGVATLVRPKNGPGDF